MMAITRTPASSSLTEITDPILDRGVGIDAFLRPDQSGVALISAWARAMIASVETQLHYAETMMGLTAARVTAMA